jgi:hypothetical protein
LTRCRSVDGMASKATTNLHQLQNPKLLDPLHRFRRRYEVLLTQRVRWGLDADRLKRVEGAPSSRFSRRSPMTRVDPASRSNLYQFTPRWRQPRSSTEADSQRPLAKYERRKVRCRPCRRTKGLTTRTIKKDWTLVAHSRSFRRLSRSSSAGQRGPSRS